MKQILVVVDMQNDFIDGVLGTVQAQGIVDKVVQKIRQYPAEAIVATKDTHQKDYLQTREGKYLPVEHCIQGTWGWELRKEVADALSGAVILEKTTFGAMQLAETVKRLAQGDKDICVEVVGLCTDICVVSNALLLKTSLPDAVIRVDASCCAGVTPESHQAALLTMKMCQVEV